MNIQKYVLYGTLKYRLRISAGILIGYFFAMIILYFYYALKNEYKRIADKTPLPPDGEIEDYGVGVLKKHDSDTMPVLTGGVELQPVAKYVEVPSEDI